MSQLPHEYEVESQVYRPGLWIWFMAGFIFFAMGVGLFFAGGEVPRNIPVWVVKLVTVIVALVGALLIAYGVVAAAFPVSIRHTCDSTLRAVPREPLVYEGAVVHGRLTHELRETDSGWEFRPAEKIWRNDKRFLVGFGVPFTAVFACILTNTFHQQVANANWIVSAIAGVLVTTMTGGVVLALIGMFMRAGYRRLATLTIPRGEAHVIVESSQPPDPQNARLADGLNWLLVGGTDRHRLAIPRDLIAAVQLCPWKLDVGSSGERTTASAVQGLLVLRVPQEQTCHRFSLCLTLDYVGAARLLRSLADVLNVPYLFHADLVGWKAERARAKNRPRLHAGGFQT